MSRMNLLVLGGTRFMGRRIVENALAAGHNVTLFNRGRDGADLFPGQVERVTGDRDGEISLLAGRKFDAIVDTPGFYPRVVKQTTDLFRDSVDRYLFISSISAYDPAPGVAIDENSPLATLKDETVEEITPETYGGLKAACERVVQDAFGDRAIIIRPGYIVGAFDPSDRFTYYPWRLMQGGRMLCGGKKDAPLQIIDARDIGAFCFKAIVDGASGIFNVCGPTSPLQWSEFLSRGRAALDVDTELVWADAAAFEEKGGQPGIDLPLYHGLDEATDSMMRVSNSRAVVAGLTFRPVEDTVRETAEWVKSLPDHQQKVGMTREREQELMTALSV